MKLWVMSDIHLEFHADGGAEFLESLPDVEHDVAIVAGDVSVGDFGIPSAIRRLSNRFEQIIYVIGNHECYGTSIGNAVSIAEDAASGLDNVHFLECGTVTIGGIRFHGASLWFPYSGPAEEESGMNDFWQIRGIREDVDRFNLNATAYLQKNTRPGDIVVTHHLPSVHSVAEQYADSPLNQFFVGAAAHVFEREPSTWIHGHTHSSVDVMVNKTRVVCNPFGYIGHDVNPKFNPGLVIEI